MRRARAHTRSVGSERSVCVRLLSYAAGCCWPARLHVRLPSSLVSFNSFSPISRPAGQDHTMHATKLHCDLHHAFIHSCPGPRVGWWGAIMSGAEPVIDRSDRDEAGPAGRPPRWSASCMAADRALHKRAVILIHCCSSSQGSGLRAQAAGCPACYSPIPSASLRRRRDIYMYDTTTASIIRRCRARPDPIVLVGVVAVAPTHPQPGKDRDKQTTPTPTYARAASPAGATNERATAAGVHGNPADRLGIARLAPAGHRLFARPPARPPP